MRRFSSTRILYAIGLWGCCLVGCGGSGDQIIDEMVREDGSKPAAPKIAKVGDYLPPLDRDRVQIAPPEGWYTLPRNPKYLVCFALKRGVPAPKIIVTVRPFDEIDEVTAENLSEYGKLLGKPGKDLQRRRIEDFIGIGYTKQGTIKTGVRTLLLDQQFLDTVVDHRRYRFELRVKEKSLEKYMPDLLAVAVRTRFLKRKGIKSLEDFTEESPTDAKKKDTKKIDTKKIDTGKKVETKRPPQAQAAKPAPPKKSRRRSSAFE